MVFGKLYYYLVESRLYSVFLGIIVNCYLVGFRLHNKLLGDLVVIWSISRFHNESLRMIAIWSNPGFHNKRFGDGNEN